MSNKKNYDEYIVFLLGADNFDVCHKLRKLAEQIGMDETYEYAVYIAQKFNEYDDYVTKELNFNWSQYDCFEEFLSKHETKINNYIDNSIEFEIEKN